jgi:hypothetical protein
MKPCTSVLDSIAKDRRLINRLIIRIITCCVVKPRKAGNRIKVPFDNLFGITKGSSNIERGQLIPNRFMYGEEGTLAALLVNAIAVARHCQLGVCLSSKARLRIKTCQSTM